MIQHRATVFETNSARYFKNHREMNAPPPGTRALWADRGKLATAKLADAITHDTNQTSFPTLLLKGTPDDDDEYIEVHIYGPISIHTMERLIFDPSVRRELRKTILDHIQERLEKIGIPMEIR